MRSSWMKHVVVVALWVTIALAGFGTAVWQLWNLLMPDVFGLRPIGFWQACGLLGLSWLLFGGWRWSGRGHSYGARMMRHGMTDEEREAFRAAMRDRCATRKGGEELSG